jgi:hypothetical protein
MNRRNGETDPTGQRVLSAMIAKDAAEELRVVLKSMPPEEMIVLTALSAGVPARVLARRFGVTPKTIRNVRAKAISKLRHPSAGARMSKLASDFVDETPEQLLGNLIRQDPRLATVAERYLRGMEQGTCAHCSARIQEAALRGAGGRPRKYCSSACRQAAYRTRSKRTADTQVTS